jgi:hypothetical protein
MIASEYQGVPEAEIMRAALEQVTTRESLVDMVTHAVKRTEAAEESERLAFWERVEAENKLQTVAHDAASLAWGLKWALGYAVLATVVAIVGRGLGRRG